MVMFEEVAERLTPVPAVMVTSVPVLLTSVTGEDAPENDKSVPLPEVAAMVTTPSRAVPVVVRVMFAPSTNCSEPPAFDSVAVCVVAVLPFDRV